MYFPVFIKYELLDQWIVVFGMRSNICIAVSRHLYLRAFDISYLERLIEQVCCDDKDKKQEGPNTSLAYSFFF